jgi:hypothetical protein
VSAAGQPYEGGLVGANIGGTVDQSYSSGTVIGGSYVGGLVGFNAVLVTGTGTLRAGVVSNSYATGSVTGSGSATAGFVGENDSMVTGSYAAGSVSAPNPYGFMGAGSGTVANSYWSTAGAASDFSTTTQHLTGSEPLQQASYGGFDFSKPIWRIYEGHTAPLLEALLTPLTITADNLNINYNGGVSTPALSNPIYSVSGADTSGHLQGLGTPYAGDRNVGTYAPALWSDQQGYDITVVNGSLTINKATLTLAATGNTKTYDGTTSAAGVVTVTGAAKGDSASATESYESRNVLGAGGSTLQVNSGYTITDAGGADMSGNYTVVPLTAAGTIIPVTLAVTGATAATKVYDGSTVANISGGGLSGVIGTDAVSLVQMGSFSDKNVGTNKVVQEDFGLTGGDAQNYILANSTAQTTASITPRTLTVSGIVANDKPYDGTTAATLNTRGVTLAGAVMGDSLAVSAVGTFATASAGVDREVALSNLTLTGADSGNYVLAASGNESYTVANITPASLTITANNAAKMAGVANPPLTVTYSGFVPGESSASLTTAPSMSTTASTNSPAGTYAITAFGADDSNYTISYVPGTLTVTNNPATSGVNSSPGYQGALSSLTQPYSTVPTIGDPDNQKNKSDDSEIYAGMLDVDTPKRITEALPILALIVLDKGIRLPDGVE